MVISGHISVWCLFAVLFFNTTEGGFCCVLPLASLSDSQRLAGRRGCPPSSRAPQDTIGGVHRDLTSQRTNIRPPRPVQVVPSQQHRLGGQNARAFVPGSFRWRTSRCLLRCF
ncbi:hypothetical protein B0T16DRAFT_185994 [Cercophora newfieldiana]|uniref:Secreted protein n=1 Tax=Cercophora newfieldiana TaxID=92897 RepID=A0AA39Y091_9PEZI|nr:hypothetical protein B0T16DRAFT_185994 [Cercophora newfieldiana]